MRSNLTPIVEADLHALVDGNIASDRRHAMAQYLTEHPDDAARVDAWRRQNESILAAFGPIAEENVPVSLSLVRSTATRFQASSVAASAVSVALVRPPQAKAATPQNDLASLDFPGKRGGFSIASFSFGLAIAFGLAGLGFEVLEGRMHLLTGKTIVVTDARSEFAERALEAHRTFARDGTRFVEVLALNNGTVPRNFISKGLGIALVAPDLSGEGFALAGGRLTPAVAGPAAWLLYTGANGETLSLLAAAAPASQPEGFLILESNDLSAIAGRSGDFNFALTSTAKHGKLLNLARLISKTALTSR